MQRGAYNFAILQREYSRITLSDNTSTRRADVLVRNWW